LILQAHARWNNTVEPVVLCGTVTLATEEAPARNGFKLLFCHPLTMAAFADEEPGLIGN